MVEIFSTYHTHDRNPIDNFDILNSCFEKKIWPPPWHVEILRPGIEPTPQERPEPLQWQCQIFKLWHYKGTPENVNQVVKRSDGAINIQHTNQKPISTQ